MDDARLLFLFGAVPAADDVRDEEGRSALLQVDRPDVDGSGALRTVIANQILDDDPPQAWTAAQRLLELGLDRHDAMDKLTSALLPVVRSALGSGPSLDPGFYAAMLEGLPTVVAAVTASAAVAREHVAIGSDELWRLTAERVGTDVEGVRGIEASLLGDPRAPLMVIPPDVIVHVPALAAGIVLTHRLSDAERTDGYLDVDTDLAGFLRFPDPSVDGDPVDVDPISWGGPEGWLAGHPADALLAVRVADDGGVTVQTLDDEPAAPPDLVASLRAAYDAAVNGAWLPVTAEELVVGMLYLDRAAFAKPRPPFTELAAAAGLEQRGNEFAHDETVWAAGDEADRHHRLLDLLGPGAEYTAAVEAFDLLAGGADDPASLRTALVRLGHPDVLVAVVEELVGIDDDPDALAALVALGDRLLAVAGRTPRAAVAGWIAAYAAERDGRVLDAESHLRAASIASDGWPLVEDRLAQYESDRGDAATALGRWRSVDAPDDDPDVAAVLPFAAAAGPEPGRNEPCHCGSGRKYKQCHLGRPVMAPLPERVDWLHRKAVSYLEQRGGSAAVDLEDHAVALGDDGEDEDIDPLVVDAVLHEGGWFARFLADRGPLLPADEAELAASWLPVARSVHEVTGVRYGSGLRLRDLRGGAERDVTTTVASQVGALLCARVLPDGAAGHRILSDVVDVPRGRQRELLEVLDGGDGLDLLEWVADLEQA